MAYQFHKIAIRRQLCLRELIAACFRPFSAYIFFHHWFVKEMATTMYSNAQAGEKNNQDDVGAGSGMTGAFFISIIGEAPAAGA